MEGILAVKKNNYEKICIIRLVMVLPVHGVYDVLSIPVVIKCHTEPILLQSLYEDLYCDPLFEVVGAVQRPIPFGGWFIGHFFGIYSLWWQSYRKLSKDAVHQRYNIIKKWGQNLKNPQKIQKTSKLTK